MFQIQKLIQNTEQQIFYLKVKKKPSVKEMIRLIIFSYEKFFFNLNSYNFTDFKKKADLMSLN